jgi:hypothetical protein
VGQCCGDDRVLVCARRERQDGEEPSRRAAELEPGQLACERLQEGIAALAVAVTLAAQVAVEVAALDEIGECELVDRRGRARRRRRVVGMQLRDQAGRKDEPAESQGGRERLGARAAVGNEVGREALERSDRLAVVAELRVVVVFEDQRAAVAGPGNEVGTSLRPEDGAGRELVGGGDGDGVEVEVGEAAGRG